MGLTVTYKDFSGGLTDHYLDGGLTYAQTITNLLVDADKKLYKRSGQSLYNTTYGLAFSNTKINALVPYNSDANILTISGRDAKYLATGWTALTGPTGNQFLGAGTTSQYISWANWKGHSFVTNDAGSRVMKMYIDSGGTLRVRNAGLPFLAESANYVEATVLAAAIALANELQTDFLYHFRDYGAFEIPATGPSTGIDQGFIFSYISGDVASGSPTITNIADTTNIAVGMYISALNDVTELFASGTTVLSKTATTVTASNNASGTKTGSLCLFHFQNKTSRIPWHWASDSTDYTTLNAVAVASNQATLITLANALKDTFTNHIEDTTFTTEVDVDSYPVGNRAHRNFHYRPVGPSGAVIENRGASSILLSGTTTNPDATLSPPRAVTTLADTVLLLRELYDKWLAHTSAWETHYFLTNNVATDTQYAISAAKPDILTSGVVATENHAELISFINELKDNLNDHMANLQYHWWAGDTRYGVRLADATDLNSAWDLLIDIRSCLAIHFTDALQADPISGTAGSITTGSNVITYAAPIGFAVAQYMSVHCTELSFGDFSYVEALDTGAGTVTVDKISTDSRAHEDSNSSVTDASKDFLFSYSKFHAGLGTETNTMTGTPTWGDADSIRTKAIETATAFNAHDSDADAHLALAPVNTYRIDYTPPTYKSYAYAFLYFYEYVTTPAITFQDFGPVTYLEAITTSVTEANGVAISGIPAIANSTVNNWDTTAIKVKIYRTLDAGTTYFYVGEVTNGTTTFEDNYTDDEISENELIYTTGGVVSNDTPPIAKYIHITNGKAYYLNITDWSGEVLTNRVVESITNDPDSVPETFYDELDEAGTGINSYKGRVICFSSKAVYRLEGGFDELGRGALTHEKIYDVDGCVSNNSIVQIPEGLVYAGNYGFYYTDGYQVVKLSEHLNRTYALFTTNSSFKAQIHGSYDPINRHVWWACGDTTAGINNTIFILDTRWGLRPAGAFFKFTSQNSQSKPSMKASYLLWHLNEMHRGDDRGYVFKFSSSSYSDPMFLDTADTIISATAGDGLPILYDYVSAATDFGDAKNRKWVPRMKFLVENESTDLTTRIRAIRDAGTATSLKEVRIISSGVREHSRWMPLSTLRCSLRQTEFTNNIVGNYVKLIDGSTDTTMPAGDEYGDVTITKATGQVVLASGSFPADVLGNYFLYSGTYFVIKSVSGGTITILDTASLPASATTSSWSVVTVGAREKFKLLEYSLDYSVRSMSQDTFKSDSTDTGI